MEEGELKQMFDLQKVGRLKYHPTFPAYKMRFGHESSLYNTLVHDLQIASYFQKTSNP